MSFLNIYHITKSNRKRTIIRIKDVHVIKIDEINDEIYIKYLDESVKGISFLKFYTINTQK